MNDNPPDKIFIISYNSSYKIVGGMYTLKKDKTINEDHYIEYIRKDIADKSNCKCIIKDNEVTEYCALHAYMENKETVSHERLEAILKPIRHVMNEREDFINDKYSRDDFDESMIITAIKETLAIADMERGAGIKQEESTEPGSSVY